MSARCVVTARCHVEVKSITGGDFDKCHGNYVKLNGTLIYYFPSPKCPVNASITSAYYRGVQIHLIDPFTCSAIEVPKRFDTWTSNASAVRLSDYLKGLDDFAVITGHMLDDAANHLSFAHDALMKLGVDLRGLKYRGTFAFVTQKRNAKEAKLSMVETWEDSKKNPANLSAMITGM